MRSQALIRSLRRLQLNRLTARLLTVCLSALLLAGSTAHAETLRGFTVSSEVTDRDIADLARWNTNVIRYHLHWDSRANDASGAEYLAWLGTALQKLDSTVASCRKRGLKIIVNLHTPPGGFKSTFVPSLHRLFAEDWAYETFLEAWRLIATRYQGNKTIWGYDILNEPALRPGRPDYRTWASIAQETGEMINAIDADKRIIVEPVYGDQSRLSSIRTLSFPNLVISPHLYYPWKFHHQGLYGVPLGTRYPNGRFDKRSIVSRLSALQRYHAKRKIPIYIGEFTAIRWAPKGSAYRYLKDLIPLLERRGWHWTYHSFREADPWNLERSSKFGDSSPSPGDTDRLQLLKRYLSRNVRDSAHLEP